MDNYCALSSVSSCTVADNEHWRALFQCNNLHRDYSLQSLESVVYSLQFSEFSYFSLRTLTTKTCREEPHKCRQFLRVSSHFFKVLRFPRCIPLTFLLHLCILSLPFAVNRIHSKGTTYDVDLVLGEFPCR